MSKVAIVEFNGDVQEAFTRALKLIGKIDDLNDKDRNVVIKVGVFNPKGGAYSTVNMVDAIIKSFNKAPKIFLAESDNYKGKGLERLQIWKEQCWDSTPRYTAIHQALRKHSGKIDLETAQSILANHSGYVCSHQKKIKLGTLWSIAATLKKLQIFRAEGHPCKTKFRQDLRLNKAIMMRSQN